MRIRRVFALFALVVVFDGVPALASGPPVTDADAGDAVIVDPINTDRELANGSSTSAFSLRLPDGAVCPGDSANDDWRVQSFLVPADTDIGALRYRATRPDGDAFRSLRYLDGDHFVMEFTDPNPGPGEPGRILAIPLLTMAYFPTGSLEPGPYLIGVACTDPDWYVRRYWDARVDLVAAPEVEPGGLRWTAIDTPNPDPVQGSPGFGVVVPLVLLVGVALGGFLVLRRRRPVAQPQKEPA